MIKFIIKFPSKIGKFGKFEQQAAIMYFQSQYAKKHSFQMLGSFEIGNYVVKIGYYLVKSLNFIDL